MEQRESPLDKIRKTLMWFGQLVRQEITSKGIILPCEGNTEFSNTQRHGWKQE